MVTRSLVIRVVHAPRLFGQHYQTARQYSPPHSAAYIAATFTVLIVRGAWRRPRLRMLEYK